MVISGLHVNVRTSAAVRISRHGFGRSLVLVCTHTVTFLKNVYQPNFSQSYKVMETSEKYTNSGRVREEIIKIQQQDFSSKTVVKGKCFSDFPGSLTRLHVACCLCIIM